MPEQTQTPEQTRTPARSRSRAPCSTHGSPGRLPHYDVGHPGKSCPGKRCLAEPPEIRLPARPGLLPLRSAISPSPPGMLLRLASCDDVTHVGSIHQVWCQHGTKLKVERPPCAT